MAIGSTFRADSDTLRFANHFASGTGEDNAGSEIGVSKYSEFRYSQGRYLSFERHPEAPDLKEELITGTRSEIESLKKRDTCCKHYYKLFDIFDCCFVFLQIHIGNVFHHALFQFN